MGRPTKYSEEMLQQAKHYLEFHEDEFDDVVPSIEGLGCALNVVKNTILNWGKDENNPEFLHTLDMIKQRQAKLLFNFGLTGDFVAPITKLMLHNHGYNDKSEVEKTGGTSSSLTVEFVECAK